MATVRQWSGDGLAPGALTTSSAGTGDTPFTSISGTGLAVAAGGLHAPRISVPDGAGLVNATWTLAAALGTWAVRLYVRTTTAPSGGVFFNAYDGGGNKVVGMDFTSSGALRLATKPSTTTINFYVAPTAFPLDTEIRIDYTETAAGAWTVAYYVGDDTTPIHSSSGTKATAQTISSLVIGRLAAAPTYSGLFIDSIALTDTASPIGPVVTAPPPPLWHIRTAGGWVGARLHVVAP